MKVTETDHCCESLLLFNDFMGLQYVDSGAIVSRQMQLRWYAREREHNSNTHNASNTRPRFSKRPLTSCLAVYAMQLAEVR